MLLAVINPWSFAVVFVIVLLVIVLVSRMEPNAAVKPFR